MDIVFAIDASDYMGATNFKTAIRSVEMFTERLYIHPDFVRVGIVSYHKALTIAPFLRDSLSNQVVTQALQIHKFKGGTPDLASTLRLLRMKVFHVSNGARPGIPKVGGHILLHCIIFSTLHENYKPVDECPPFSRLPIY